MCACGVGCESVQGANEGRISNITHITKHLSLALCGVMLKLYPHAHRALSFWLAASPGGNKAANKTSLIQV